MKKPVQLAIIGSGAIAKTHADAISRLPDANLAGVFSRNAQAARTLGGQALVFDSLEALLSSPAVDAVLIAAPSGAHLDSAIPALRAGKHVLCEKPLEISGTNGSAILVNDRIEYWKFREERSIDDAIRAGAAGGIIVEAIDGSARSGKSASITSL